MMIPHKWHITEGDPKIGPLLDINGPENVEIEQIGNKLWVNVDGICRLRIQGAKTITNERKQLSISELRMVALALAIAVFGVAIAAYSTAYGKDGAVCPPYTVGPDCRPMVSRPPSGYAVCPPNTVGPNCRPAKSNDDW